VPAQGVKKISDGGMRHVLAGRRARSSFSMLVVE
jgi:hypothetical protein